MQSRPPALQGVLGPREGSRAGGARKRLIDAHGERGIRKEKKILLKFPRKRIPRILLGFPS